MTRPSRPRLRPYTLWDRLFAFRALFRRPGRPASARLGVDALEERLVPEGRPLPLPIIYTGTGQGPPPLVRAFDAETGDLRFEKLVADAAFTGGVRVATADFTKDGIPDLVVSYGPGGGPRVQVLDGTTGEPIPGSLGSFFAYVPNFTGGVQVAAGDVDGDRIPDVITAAGAGGGPHVQVFSGADGSLLRSFFAFEPDFRGGVSIAAADFNGDGRVDLAVGAGAGGGPRVRVFDLTTNQLLAGPLGNFFAFDESFRGGVAVGADNPAGDVDGDGTPDLVVGTGPGVPSAVKVFSGKTGQVIRSFAPFDAAMTAGVTVALNYSDDDAFADLVVGTGPGTPATVRVFSGATLAPVALPTAEFQPFGPSAMGGVSLAASNDPPAVSVTGVTTPVAENGGMGTFTLTRTGDTTDPLTVSFSLGGTATSLIDFSYTGFMSATFAAGSATATFSFTSTDDTSVEGNETVVLALMSGVDYELGTPALGTITITDDDTAPPPPPPPGPGSVGDQVWYDANENMLREPGEAGAAGVPVALVQNGTTVATTQTDGSGQYAFTGVAAGTYTVAFTAPTGYGFSTPLNGTWPVIVTAGNHSTADAGLVALPPPQVVTVAKLQDGAEPSTSGVFRLTRSGTSAQVAEPLTVALTAGGTATAVTDYMPLPSSVTFMPGVTQYDLPVWVLPDNLVENPNETVVAGVAPPTDSSYQVGSSSTATVTIADDPAVVTVSGDSPHTTEGHTGGIWITRSGGDTSQSLTVQLEIGAGGGTEPLAVWATDYTLTVSGGGSASLGTNGGSVTFEPGQTELLLTLTALADTTAEETEAFALTVTPGAVPATYLAGWGVAAGESGGWGSSTLARIADNAPPVAQDDDYSTQDDPVSGIVVGTDPDGDTLTFFVTASPGQGQADMTSDGTFTYTPNAGATGTDTFQFTAADGQGGTATGTVTITFTNADPTADPQDAATWPGEAVSFGWTGWDTDEDTLTVTGWSDLGRVSGDVLEGGYGSVSYSAATGQFTYTPPDVTWTGTVAFEYTLSDGHGGTADGMVTITVLPDGTAEGVDDNYQLSEDGTLTVQADEGVLVNDTLPEGTFHAVLTAPLDSSIGTVTLNGDGGFTITLTAAAMGTATPVSIGYDIMSLGGLVVGHGTATFQTAFARFTWFRAAEVTFDTTAYRPIVSDNGKREYKQLQWLDTNVDGVPEESDPIHFVRNVPASVRASRVTLDPALVSNLDPTKYKLVGELVLGTPIGGSRSGISRPEDSEPSGIVIESGAGVRDGRRWVFSNLTLTATSLMFTDAVYYPDLTIRWTLLRLDGQDNRQRAGQTATQTYITFNPVQAGPDYQLLRTFVHIGSTGISLHDPVDTDAAIIAQVWSSFQMDDFRRGVRTWDGTPLIYYNDWTARYTPDPRTTSRGLLTLHEGECASFAKLFIDALRAQGIEQNEFTIVTPKPVPGQQAVMFVGSWTAQGEGAPVVPNAGLPFLPYKWWNGTAAYEQGRDGYTRAGWALVNGQWAYSWTAAQVSKTANDPLEGQNNRTPLGIFGAHILVKIDGTYYDPSYGRTAFDIRNWEDRSVAFYGLAARNYTINNVEYKLVYILKENRTEADRPVDVEVEAKPYPARE